MDALSDRTLAVVGCGPKALAIAAKAKVLRELQVAHIKVTVFEKTEIAAHWCGRGGYTDGVQPLGTPPEKDLGFPYRSIFGKTVDQQLLAYSWTSFLIDTGAYAQWIDRGKPQPEHRHWAAYLRWAAGKSEVEIRIAEITDIIPNPKEQRVRLRFRDLDASLSSQDFDGVVFTGPGDPIKIHDDPRHPWNEEIIDGKTFWQRLPIFAVMDGGDVALVGSGETAASIVLALLKCAPKVRIHVINRHGILYTRGESYHENQFFTDPSDWPNLDVVDRDDFLKRTDRGVFSVASKRDIDRAGNFNLITGNVIQIRNRGCQVEVKVQRHHKGEYHTFPYKYDRVIVAIGFDPLTPFKFLPERMRPEKKILLKTNGYVDYHLRVPLVSTEEAENMTPINIHLPMLAGLAQGPGFPNLSCLGTLSDRILLAYLPDALRPQEPVPKRVEWLSPA